MDSELQNHFDNEDFIDDKQKKTKEMDKTEVNNKEINMKSSDEVKEDKEKKGKVGKKKVKKVNISKDMLSFDMSLYPEEKQLLENYIDQANNKSIGDSISKEMILSHLIKMIDDDFIFSLQKESLSHEELNGILKNQFCKIH